MSTLKLKNIQVGTSVTASENLTIYQPASPDGTLRVASGNVGSSSDVLVVSTSGITTSSVSAAVRENVTTSSSSGASYSIDCASTSIFSITLTDNCTFSLTNVPSGGFGITLKLTQDATGSRTVTWPASFKWPGGVEPTLSLGASDVDVLTAFTDDGGTTWYGFLAGLDFQ